MSTLAKQYYFLDIETTGLSDIDDKLHGISVLEEEDDAYYHPVWDMPAEVREKLADPNITKVFHSGKRFDIKFLIRAGIPVAGTLVDTLLMYQMIDENQPLGLKPLSLKYIGPNALKNKSALDKAMAEAGVKNLGAFCKLDLIDPAHPHYEIIARYAQEDICNTFKLFHLGIKRLREIHKSVTTHLNRDTSPLTYFLTEIVPTESALLQIELPGVKVDTALIDQIKQQYLDQKNTLEAKLNSLAQEEVNALTQELLEKALAGKTTEKGKQNVLANPAKYKAQFNWQSSDHIGRLFFEKLNCSPALVKKTDKGAYSTTETQLKFIRAALPYKHRLCEILDVYAKYKKTLKMVGTYTGNNKKGIVSRIRVVESLPKIFTEYPQMTKTGRLSSRNPNMQNLPRTSVIKRFFVPDNDSLVFVSGDYSQLELRIMAHLSQDEALLEAYRMDEDLHKRTAASIFTIAEEHIDDIQRQVGKTCNFLITFMGFAKRLQGELKEKNGLDFSIDDCKAFITRYFEKYAGVKKYHSEQIAFMKRYGFVISENGRVRRLPDMSFGNYLNYKSKEFTGPTEMVMDLKRRLYAKERIAKPTPEQLFWKASGIYNHAIKQGINSPVQGLGATITKKAIVGLQTAGFKPCGTVHDSIVTPISKDRLYGLEQVKEIMENSYKLSVPIKVDIGLTKSFDSKDAYEPEQTYTDDTYTQQLNNPGSKG